MDRCGFRGQAPSLKSLRLIADPLQRDPGEPRETEDAAAGGGEIDHSSARERAPISDRNDNTVPIGVIGHAHAAAERQRLVRGGQFTIVQMATAGSLCT